MKLFGTVGTILIAVAASAASADSPIAAYVKSIDGSLTPDTAAIAGVFGKTVDQLRDPKSLQVVDLFIKQSNDAATGCMEYRAKNGFGGYNVGHAVWVLRVKGGKPTLLFTSNNAANWNKWCTGGGFSDRTAMARALIAKIQ